MTINKPILESLLQKPIIIRLKNQFFYSGYIIQLIDGETLLFRDKYARKVYMNIGEISQIEEVNLPPIMRDDK